MSELERGMEVLRHRAAHYRDVFLGHGKSTDAVLKDLSIFCRAHQTSFHENQRMTDVLIGRQEVWLRIQTHLKLNEEELWGIYGNKQIIREPKE